MKNKEISYEIIDFSGETNVQFRTSVDPGSYIPTHWHRAIEIIYMQEGSLDVTVESESFTIHEGDCILVNGNVLHSTKCTAPNTAILLQIPLDFMAKYIPDLGQFLFLWDYRTDDPVKKTKLMMLKTTLEQLQVINDIRPDGYLLRFNSTKNRSLWTRSQTSPASRPGISAASLRKKWELPFWNIRMNTGSPSSTKI